MDRRSAYVDMAGSRGIGFAHKSRIINYRNEL